MNSNSENVNFGSCMMDYTTLYDAAHCLDFCCSNYTWFRDHGYIYDWFSDQIQKHYMQCLINFTEALVLQQEIFVPFLFSGWFNRGNNIIDSAYAGDDRKIPNFFKGLYENNIIKELRVDKEVSLSLKSAYEEHAKSVSFARKFSGSIRNIEKLYTYDEILSISDSSSGNPFFRWNEFIDIPSFHDVNFEILRKRIAQGNLKYLLAGDPEPLLYELGRFILRGFAYNDIAKIESLPYIPHPLRTIFCMSDGLWSCNKVKEWGTIAVKYMNDFRRDYVSHLGENIFEIDIPFVFASIIRNCRSRYEIIPTALQLRASPSAQAFREWNKEITKALYNNEGLKVINAMRELRGLRNDLTKELGNSFDKFTANLWIISYDIKIPRFLHALSNRFLGRKHIQFLHDYAIRNLDVINLEKDFARVFYE